MTRLTTTTTPLAVSADYADALLAARRAKNWMFLLLLLGLLAQITIFFLVRFDVVKLGAGGEATISKPNVDVDLNLTTQPTTGPVGTDVDASASITTQPSRETAIVADGKNVTGTVLAWVVNSIVYLGTIASIVFVILTLLIVLIMLVGRLIGVAHTTSAFVWAVLLAALLFPWQLFHGPEAGSHPGDRPADAAQASVDTNDFRLPGFLYTWRELRADAKFPGDVTLYTITKWARFVGFPVLGLILLFMVQAKSGRGVKYALGEAEVHVDVATHDG